MIRAFLLLLVSTAVLTAASSRAQIPDGYHLGEPITLPESLHESFLAGRFVLDVSRSYGSPFERTLISAAENLYPGPDLLLSVARNTEARDQLLSHAAGVLLPKYRVEQRAAGSPQDRWWLDAFDATWIPYAVTGAAVDYYIGRMRDLAAGKGVFLYGPDETPDRGRFTYSSSVSLTNSVYQVALRITWSYTCGPMCGIGFSLERRVTFDSGGNVLQVRGDGRPSVIVS